MKIIKRNGAEVPFDITKIITAVTKASDSVGGKARLSREQITDIAAAVTDQCQALNRAVSVEEVQDMVENQLMDIKAHDIARHYITYRYIQSLKRQTNTTDERILSLIECQNEEVKQENANKNPTVNSVQRDYMAGEISKDLTARLLLDRGLDRTALLTADAAEPKSCADYRAAGLPCRAAVKGPGSVAAGMKWLQSLNAIIIDPMRCPETAAEFTGYEYLRDARTGEVTNAWPDADNHHIDAVRYALESVWRRRGS